MLLKILFRPLRRTAVLLAVLASTALFSESAWSADLQLRTKPRVQHEAPSDWRTRLFEEFQRYLLRRNY